MSKRMDDAAMKAQLLKVTLELVCRVGGGVYSAAQVAADVTELHEKFHWYRVMLDEGLLDAAELQQFTEWCDKHGFISEHFMPR